MEITRVRIENWRNFKHLEVSISGRLVVVGPNASGKSNFLDVFRFLAAIVEPGGGLAAAVDRRGGIRKIRSLFSRNHNKGRTEIEVQLSDGGSQWTYILSLKGESGGKNRAIVDREIVLRDGETVIDRPDQADLADPERLTQTSLEQISANASFRVLYEHFSRTTYLHLVPQIIRDSRRSGDDRNDPFGGDFIVQMNSVPSRTRNAWLRRMERALATAVPQFESLSITIDPGGRPHLNAGYRNWRSTLANQTEADFSDGTLRLIGLLWALVSMPTHGGTLLLEEPELSLSADVVRVLPSVLAQAQRAKAGQVILTSHSPDLVDDEGVDPSEILVLQVTDDGTTGFLLSDKEDLVQLVDEGIAVSDVIRPFVAPERIGDLARVPLLRG